MLLRARFAEPLARLTRRPRETGSGLLAQLARDGQAFHRLERTNRWNVHTVMAGIYDDAVFHLGAGSRKPSFCSDVQDYAIDDSKLRRRFARRMNASIRRWILESLDADHDGLVQQLAGGSLRRYAPIPTEAATVPATLGLTAVGQRALLD